MIQDHRPIRGLIECINPRHSMCIEHGQNLQDRRVKRMSRRLVSRARRKLQEMATVQAVRHVG